MSKKNGVPKRSAKASQRGGGGVNDIATKRVIRELLTQRLTSSEGKAAIDRMAAQFAFDAIEKYTAALETAAESAREDGGEALRQWLNQMKRTSQ
jgi:hypothetical protein